MRFTLVAPRSGHEASLELFRRQLPPRLARVTDLTGEARVAWLVGAHGFQTLAESGRGHAGVVRPGGLSRR